MVAHWDIYPKQRSENVLWMGIVNYSVRLEPSYEVRRYSVMI